MDSCEAAGAGVRVRCRRVRVLCAPKFGALMRDTLRPDALPASPVAPRHGCGWPFVLVLVVRLAALHSQPVRLCWVSCGLLLAAAGSLGCVRVRAVSVSFRLHRLRLCSATLYPCKPCATLAPAAPIVSHLVRLCWFAAGSFLFRFNASQCSGFLLLCQALRLCFFLLLCCCWFLLLLCTL